MILVSIAAAIFTGSQPTSAGVLETKRSVLVNVTVNPFDSDLNLKNKTVYVNCWLARKDFRAVTSIQGKTLSPMSTDPFPKQTVQMYFMFINDTVSLDNAVCQATQMISEETNTVGSGGVGISPIPATPVTGNQFEVSVSITPHL